MYSRNRTKLLFPVLIVKCVWSVIVKPTVAASLISVPPCGAIIEVGSDRIQTELSPFLTTLLAQHVCSYSCLIYKQTHCQTLPCNFISVHASVFTSLFLPLSACLVCNQASNLASCESPRGWKSTVQSCRCLRTLAPTTCNECYIPAWWKTTSGESKKALNSSLFPSSFFFFLFVIVQVGRKTKVKPSVFFNSDTVQGFSTFSPSCYFLQCSL